MNTLLLFFALPIATIILAIVLEKLLRNPILTAATFFAIYLIVAFAAFDAEFLVYVIFYTILAFIAAVLAEFFYRRCHQNGCTWSCQCRRNHNNNNDNNTNTNTNTIVLSNQDVARIANQLANIQNNNNSNSCNNNCHNSNSASDVVTANITNNTTGGRTSWCCYRR